MELYEVKRDLRSVIGELNNLAQKDLRDGNGVLDSEVLSGIALMNKAFKVAFNALDIIEEDSSLIKGLQTDVDRLRKELKFTENRLHKHLIGCCQDKDDDISMEELEQLSEEA